MSLPPWIIPGIKCWHSVPSQLQNEDICFTPVTILSTNNVNLKVLIKDKDSKQIETNFTNLMEANGTTPEEGYNDLVEIQILNEPEILSNLQVRYNNNNIFTYIGPTLIVINPYKEIKGVFEEKIIQDIIKKNDEKIKIPHIYQISQNAISQLYFSEKSQAIVISGESGAGKTESTKYAMKYLKTLIFFVKKNFSKYVNIENNLVCLKENQFNFFFKKYQTSR